MGMQLIETVEVGSGGTSSVEFTSIPQDGIDLVLLASSRRDGPVVAGSLSIRLNGSVSYDTGKRLRGDGSTVDSGTIYYPDSSYGQTGANATSNTFGNASFYISMYSSTTVEKTVSIDGVAANNGSSVGMSLDTVNWPSTSAVTSIALSTSPTYQQYSTFSLYKITAD